MVNVRSTRDTNGFINMIIYNEWGVVDDFIHDTINRDYYISCRSSCGGVRVCV